MPVTIRQVITDALTDLTVLQEGEAASDTQALLALRHLNMLLDEWNADRLKVPADQWLTFTLTPSLSPHTIGPIGATWSTSQRPVTIEGASLIYPGSTSVYQTLNLRDAAWWHEQTTPELATSIPTDLYYDPTWPNGSLYFWPVPTTAYQVELWCRVVLAQVVLSDEFSMAPGYKSAVTFTLAEYLAVPWAVPVPPALAHRAMLARARVFANNDPTPRLATDDAGMPARQRPSFNYLTGSNNA